VTRQILQSITKSLSEGATAVVRHGAARIKFGEVARYGVTTIVGYGVLYVGAYLLIERARVAPELAYMLLLTFLYVAVYASYSLFVFRERVSRESLRRFIIALVFMWALNNAFFYVLNRIFSIHYLVVITLNILLFGGIRFCVQRFYVFRASA
jgi:hypothetical protein